MRDYFTFSSAGELVFGENVISQIKQRCQAIGVNKPMIVTTGLKSTDIIPNVKKLLKECLVYDKVSPEPKSSQALKCVQTAKENGCDGYIGIGGGSSMDLAKVAAVLHQHGGRPADYVGENNVPGPVVPVVAVPTTAGSGSEVTSVASLGNDDQGEFFKAALSDNYLRPKLSLVDPLLLMDLPPKLTAECGFDALAHNIESYTAVEYRYVDRPEGSIFNGKSPLSAALAEKGISLVYNSIRKAVYQPQNRQAKYDLALGSVLGGLSFGSAGLGAVHAGYYVVAEKAHTSHSLTVGTILPHVMRFNVITDPEPYAAIADVIGVGRQNMDVFEKATAAVEAVEALIRDLGLPRNISDLGIKKEDVPELAERAVVHERLVRGNCRKMDVAEFEKLLYSAL
jgi:alcohol dehydrogenase class IV